MTSWHICACSFLLFDSLRSLLLFCFSIDYLFSVLSSYSRFWFSVAPSFFRTAACFVSCLILSYTRVCFSFLSTILSTLHSILFLSTAVLVGETARIWGVVRAPGACGARARCVPRTPS
ncbi:hypothetical protein C8R45DRAFT_1011343 [Mycena sanguinolenta]|nr:hypothetical protein C8R45DRAFT_1011343 [Mycena sanguinolenta]